MSDYTLIQALDDATSFLQGVKKEILETRDNTLINASLGEGISKLIESQADVDDKDKLALDLHLRALSTFLDASHNNDLELDGLTPNAQIQSINQHLDLFEDSYVDKMRNIISLGEEHHDGLKLALNVATGNLMGKMGILEIVNKTSKAERDKLTSFSDSIPSFLTRIQKVIPSFVPIFLGAQSSLIIGKHELNAERASEQYLRLQRVSEDLKELCKLREELESEGYAFLFGRRSAGNIPDVAIKGWVFEIWHFLTETANVKPTLSREAKITSLMEMGLERLNLGLSSSKIFDVAKQFRNSRK